ncbi:MAG: acyloxyacyl hydrolase, partial [Alphaproteobacteria bacterium]
APPARGLAQRPAPPPPADADPTLLALAIGYYDFNDNEDAAEFRVEWRGRDWLWRLKPLAGVMVSSDAAFYGYGGLAVDFDLGRRFVLTPSLAAGLYADGSGKDLGSVIEFRSAIELAWKLEDGARLGLMLYHISNAGISDDNPGTEVLSLGYAIPLN